MSGADGTGTTAFSSYDSCDGSCGDPVLVRKTWRYGVEFVDHTGPSSGMGKTKEYSRAPSSGATPGLDPSIARMPLPQRGISASCAMSFVWSPNASKVGAYVTYAYMSMDSPRSHIGKAMRWIAGSPLTPAR